MTRQELIDFLDQEAEHALKDILPQILDELEVTFVPGSFTFVTMGPRLSNYREANMRTIILNKAVSKLGELGYHVSSGNQDGAVGIYVS